MKSIKKNIVLNGIRTFISFFFPFILFQYASQIILAENLGKVNFSNSVVNYFILIAGLGVSAYSIRESGKYINEKKLPEFASEMFSLNILSTIVSCGLLCIFLIASQKMHNYWLLIAIQSTAILSSTFSLDWVNIVYEDYVYITLRTFFFQMITLILTFIFVRNVGDYVTFATIVVLGKVGPDVLNWFYIRKKYLKVKLFFSRNIRNHIKPVLIIFFNALVISIYVNIDTTMIGFIKGDADVGYYSVSVKIYTALKTVFSAIISVLIPRMSLHIASKEFENAKKLISSALETFIIVVVPLILFMCINADKIIDILFGPSYSQSILSLQIISIGILFAVFASVIINCIFLPLALEKYSLIATSISAVLNLLLNFYFIRRWGIYGAAATTVASECVVFITAYLFMKKKNLKFFSLVRLQYLLLAVVVCIFVAAFYLLNKQWLENDILDLVAQVFMICVLYILLFKRKILLFNSRRKKI